MGEMLMEQKAAGGMAKRGPDKATGQGSQRDTSDNAPTLSDMGISKSMSSRAQAKVKYSRSRTMRPRSHQDIMSG
jgi:hypothetical protein